MLFNFKEFNNLVYFDDLFFFIFKAIKYFELRNNFQVFEYEMCLCVKDGSYKWVFNCGWALIWNEEGYFIQGSGIFVDIIFQKGVMMQFKVQQEFFDMVFESVMVFFWELDFDIEYVKIFFIFFKIFGFEIDEFKFMLMSVFELVYFDDQELCFNYVI